MDKALKAKLSKDPDGLQTYEFIANNIQEIDPILDELIENMVAVDPNGQFTVSAARYLHAIDCEKYAPPDFTSDRGCDRQGPRAQLSGTAPSLDMG